MPQFQDWHVHKLDQRIACIACSQYLTTGANDCLPALGPGIIEAHITGAGDAAPCAGRGKRLCDLPRSPAAWPVAGPAAENYCQAHGMDFKVFTQKVESWAAFVE